MSYIRTVLHGSGDADEFQIGWMLHPVETLGEPALNQYVQNLIDAFAGGDAGSVQLRLNLATDQAWDRITAYGYDSTPNDPASIVATGSIGNAQGVGTGSSNVPLQNCLCVSLHSELAGASRRGRVYVPMGGSATTTGHRYGDSVVAATVQAINDLIYSSTQAWAAVDANDQPFPVIFSPKLNTSVNLARLSADSRPDTQRRRAQQQPQGTITSHDYAPPA